MTVDSSSIINTARWCACGSSLGAPIWCVTCTTSIDTDLGRIPYLTAKVATRRDGRLVMGTDPTERSAPRIAPASPSPAWDAIDAVVRWARTWTERCADQLDRRHQHLGSHDNAGLPIAELASDVSYLRRFLTALLVGPWARDFGMEVSAQAARVERLAGLEMARHPLPTPCPRCLLLSLWRLDGRDDVVCGSPDCGHTLTMTEYHALVRRLAAGGGW